MSLSAAPEVENVMPLVRKCIFAALLIPALAACGEREPEKVGPEPLNRAADAPPLKAPPPMIVRTASYRCDDRGALYVSVMTDESYVTMRDRVGDVPVRLDRNAETGRYEGQRRTLTGAGDTVRYASADRPEQECRAADE
jgi:hypothetical protein